MNTTTFSIDLNCDMGEGMPNDALLMPLISSANIACGYHAGDEKTMYETIELALNQGVSIGAHPSYPDKANFGRTNMHFSQSEVYDMVKIQIESLMQIAEKSGAKVRHVKPHGALYNMAAQDENLATAICDAVKSLDKNLVIFGLSGSPMISTAILRGVKCYNEVFADRTYQGNGTLTPRSHPNALYHNPQQVTAQVLEMILNKTVTSVEGIKVPIQADTLCLHGDGEYAVEFAQMIRKALFDHKIKIKPLYE